MRPAYVPLVLQLDDDLASLVRPPRHVVEHAVEPTASVKDAIERLGIPHTEVLAIEVNGAPAGFEQGVRAGDVVRVTGHEGGRAVPEAWRLGPSFDGWEPRFVADVHLGTLARRLRLLGFDCVYDPRLHDPELARIASADDRAVLTRDRGLLKRNEVRRGRLVRSPSPRVQLEEVLVRFALRGRFRPFTRCIRCNAAIAAVPKHDVAHRLAPGVLRDFDAIFACTGCGQAYWRGSHYDKLRALVEELDAARG